MGVLLLDCPFCPATNSSFTVAWSATNNRHNTSWRVAATCGACHSPVVATVAAWKGHDPKSVDGNLEADGLFALVQSWPERTAAGAPEFTPGPVASRFTDGEFNFQNGRWNAAVGMYRAALDLATKALEAKGKTFYDRLESLHKEGRVTADIRDWAHHVRVEGNSALHDPEDFSKEDATSLRFFTTMFLRYIFELPGKVAQFRSSDQPKENS